MPSPGESLAKGERLKIFFNRLDEAQPADGHDQAMTLLANTLNAVEDEFSSIPFNPEEPGTDGRLYPPSDRFRYAKWEWSGVRCYRQVAHATFVADNGSIQIRSRVGATLGAILFEKPGQDGRTVSNAGTAQ